MSAAYLASHLPMKFERALTGKTALVTAAAAPAKRVGTPGDVGIVIAFRATPNAGWGNGQQIVVNSGASV